MSSLTGGLIPVPGMDKGRLNNEGDNGTGSRSTTDIFGLGDDLDAVFDEIESPPKSKQKSKKKSSSSKKSKSSKSKTDIDLVDDSFEDSMSSTPSKKASKRHSMSDMPKTFTKPLSSDSKNFSSSNLGLGDSFDALLNDFEKDNTGTGLDIDLEDSILGGLVGTKKSTEKAISLPKSKQSSSTDLFGLNTQNDDDNLNDFGNDLTDKYTPSSTDYSLKQSQNRDRSGSILNDNPDSDTTTKGSNFARVEADYNLLVAPSTIPMPGSGGTSPSIRNLSGFGNNNPETTSASPSASNFSALGSISGLVSGAATPVTGEGIGGLGQFGSHEGGRRPSRRSSVKSSLLDDPDDELSRMLGIGSASPATQKRAVDPFSNPGKASPMTSSINSPLVSSFSNTITAALPTTSSDGASTPVESMSTSTFGSDRRKSLTGAEVDHRPPLPSRHGDSLLTLSSVTASGTAQSNETSPPATGDSDPQPATTQLNKTSSSGSLKSLSKGEGNASGSNTPVAADIPELGLGTMPKRKSFVGINFNSMLGVGSNKSNSSEPATSGVVTTSNEITQNSTSSSKLDVSKSSSSATDLFGIGLDTADDDGYSVGGYTPSTPSLPAKVSAQQNDPNEFDLEVDLEVKSLNMPGSQLLSLNKTSGAIKSSQASDMIVRSLSESPSPFPDSGANTPLGFPMNSGHGQKTGKSKQQGLLRALISNEDGSDREGQATPSIGVIPDIAAVVGSTDARSSLSPDTEEAPMFGGYVPTAGPVRQKRTVANPAGAKFGKPAATGSGLTKPKASVLAPSLAEVLSDDEDLDAFIPPSVRNPSTFSNISRNDSLKESNSSAAPVLNAKQPPKTVDVLGGESPPTIVSTIPPLIYANNIENGAREGMPPLAPVAKRMNDNPEKPSVAASASISSVTAPSSRASPVNSFPLKNVTPPELKSAMDSYELPEVKADTYSAAPNAEQITSNKQPLPASSFKAKSTVSQPTPSPDPQTLVELEWAQREITTLRQRVVQLEGEVSRLKDDQLVQSLRHQEELKSVQSRVDAEAASLKKRFEAEAQLIGQRNIDAMEALKRIHLEELNGVKQRFRDGVALEQLAGQINNTTGALRLIEEQLSSRHKALDMVKEGQLEARERLLTEVEEKARVRIELAEAEEYRLKGLLVHMEHMVGSLRSQGGEEKERLRQEHRRLESIQTTLDAERQAFHVKEAEFSEYVKRKTKEFQDETRRIILDKESYTSEIRELKQQLETDKADFAQHVAASSRAADVAVQRLRTEEEKIMRARQELLHEKEQFEIKKGSAMGVLQDAEDMRNIVLGMKDEVTRERAALQALAQDLQAASEHINKRSHDLDVMSKDITERDQALRESWDRLHASQSTLSKREQQLQLQEQAISRRVRDADEMEQQLVVRSVEIAQKNREIMSKSNAILKSESLLNSANKQLQITVPPSGSDGYVGMPYSDSGNMRLSQLRPASSGPVTGSQTSPIQTNENNNNINMKSQFQTSSTPPNQLYSPSRISNQTPFGFTDSMQEELVRAKKTMASVRGQLNRASTNRMAVDSFLLGERTFVGSILNHR